MKFLPKELVIGLQANKDGLQLAKITLTKNACHIAELATIESLEKVQNCRIASVFSATQTLVRSLDVALVKPKDIEATLSFEVEPLLPYPIENCVYDKIILEKSREQTKLALFVAERSDIQEHLDQLKTLQANPERIVPKSCALSHWCKLFFPDTEYHIVLDIDEDETCCLLIHSGKPIVARSLPTGASLFNQNETDAEIAVLHNYLRELARIMMSFDAHASCENLPILFTGTIALTPNFCSLISTFLQRSEAVDIPIPSSVTFADDIDWEKVRSFASAIGAGLSFRNQNETANFRTGPFIPNDFSVAFKRELIGYFSLMIVLAAACFGYGHLYLDEQKAGLIQKYSELLVIQEQPIPEDIVNMSPEDIDEGLLSIENTLQMPTDDIALHPDIPRVSDLLMWLSHHPNIAIDNAPSSIQLESLTYSMVKRPEKGKTKERYQVRVELDFSAPNATLAREFHDALLAPNPFVDPKSELKWSVHRGRYRASFFLKDRTQYPHTLLSEGSNASNQ